MHEKRLRKIICHLLRKLLKSDLLGKVLKEETNFDIVTEFRIEFQKLIENASILLLSFVKVFEWLEFE